MVTILISKREIQRKVKELAGIISYECEPGTILVGVLKGSVHFLSDLSRALSIDHQIDFLQVKSYEGMQSSGVVKILKDLDTNIEGRSVLIVEDIVDTGVTLAYLLELLSVRKPKSLKVVSLLSKTSARKLAVNVDYVGYEIPNQFVVGYGLDYDEGFRHLSYIGILHEG